MAQNHLVVANALQGRLLWNVGGRIPQCVIHWQIPAGTSVDVTLANALFSPIAALWEAHLAAFAGGTTSLMQLALRDLRAANQAEVISTAAGQSGTDAIGDNLPLSIACCVTLRTDKAGKRFRGRMYLPGFTETANGASGHMAAAMKTGADAFAAGLIAAASQSGCTLAVLSRPTTFDPDTGLPVSPGLGFVTTARQATVRDDVWDSQRRRNQ